MADRQPRPKWTLPFCEHNIKRIILRSHANNLCKDIQLPREDTIIRFGFEP